MAFAEQGSQSRHSLKVERYTRASRIALPVAAVVVIAAGTIPAWGSSNIMKQAVTFLTLVALAQMWNLLAGYAGLVSVGQQAFVGIGGLLAVGLFGEGRHQPVRLRAHRRGRGRRLRRAHGRSGLPAAGRVLRGRHLGDRGGLPAAGHADQLAGWRFGREHQQGRGDGAGAREAVVFWLALGVAVGSIALVYLLLRSRRGLALTAIRDDETGARGLGVNVFRSKLWVYIIAAFGTGVTGAVIYLNLLRLQPEAGFGLNWSALMIFAVVIGGLGTIEGPIIGAVIFFALQQLLSDYGTWYLILIGALAAGIVVFAQRGLWGTLVRRRADRSLPRPQAALP